jgi:hypothetical protein
LLKEGMTFCLDLRSRFQTRRFLHMRQEPPRVDDNVDTRLNTILRRVVIETDGSDFAYR